MPENPNTWTTIVNVFKQLPPEAMSTIMAIVIAVLRVVYDREETSVMRTILEASLCGFLAMMAVSLAKGLGLGTEWLPFIGGFIGFAGSSYIRNLAESVISRKADKL